VVVRQRPREPPAFMQELEELLDLIANLPVEMIPYLPQILESPILQAAGVENVLHLALIPLYMRMMEQRILAQALAASMRENRPRPEPPRRVTVDDYVVSVADFQAALACPVCLSQFGYKEDGVARLKCAHVFHRTCLQPWFKEHHTCPLCRTDIDEGE
jgi:hypothetical protein